MTKKYFGTDGIRGAVGEGNITPEFFLKLGWAIGRVLSDGKSGKVVIGKDTRISGYMFETALESGLVASGTDILLLGPMPTPGVAYLTRTLRAQAGIVISASHNPHQDNGIKFFSSIGHKLPDDIEHRIEAEVVKPLQTVESKHLGKVYRIEDAAGRYIEFCKSTVPMNSTFDKMRMVIDCAHGATYHIAPFVFEELGVEVVPIGHKPDGLNINKNVGSTHPQALQKAVKEYRADFGIALDGDGDRLILVDNHGEVMDGDYILYIIAQDRKRSGQLNGKVVGTVMSNLGLEHSLAKLDIGFERTDVGDRYILSRLNEKKWSLGGEPSGHIICRDRTTTGDGIVAALQVLSAINESGKTLSQLTKNLNIYPQVLINVRLNSNNAKQIMKSAELTAAVKKAEKALAGKGRVLLRPSGTEPLIRVMVEGDDKKQVKKQADILVRVVEKLI